MAGRRYKMKNLIIVTLVTLVIGVFSSNVEAKTPTMKITFEVGHTCKHKSNSCKKRIRNFVADKKELCPNGYALSCEGTADMIEMSKRSTKHVSWNAGLALSRCSMLPGYLSEFPWEKKHKVVTHEDKKGRRYRFAKIDMICLPKPKKSQIVSDICTAEDLKKSTVIRSVSTGKLVPSETHPGRLIALKDVPKNRPIGYGKRIELRCTVPRHVETVGKHDVIMPEKVKKCSAYLVNDGGKTPVVVTPAVTPAVKPTVKPVTPVKPVKPVKEDPKKPSSNAFADFMRFGWSVSAGLKFTALCNWDELENTTDSIDLTFRVGKLFTKNPTHNLNVILGLEFFSRTWQDADGELSRQAHKARMLALMEHHGKINETFTGVIGAGYGIAFGSNNVYTPVLEAGFDIHLYKKLNLSLKGGIDILEDGVLARFLVMFKLKF